MVKDVSVIILAAGLGKRMKSDIPKVMHKILGIPMIEFEIRLLEELKVKEIILVVGHKKEVLEDYFKDRVRYVEQPEQLGTGDAVRCVLESGVALSDTVLVLCGDTPMLKKDTLVSAVERFHEKEVSAAVLTVNMEDPSGYGRIIRTPDRGFVSGIIEQKDTDEAQKEIREINTGIYVFRTPVLREAVSRLDNNNSQREYYLTDAVKIISGLLKGQVIPLMYREAEQFSGINNKFQLAQAEDIMHEGHLRELMENGVRIIRSHTVYIEKDVRIADDVVIHPGTVLRNGTCIGPRTEIIGGYIENCRIGEDCIVSSSFLRDAVIEDHQKIGPYVEITGDLIGNKRSV